MIDLMDAKDLYLSHFADLETSRVGRGDRYLSAMRTSAMDRFAEQGFPTPRDEEWRFTPLARLAEIPFQTGDLCTTPELTGEELAGLLPDVGSCHQIVLVNGSFAPALSRTLSLPAGVQLGSLAVALRDYRELVEPHLGEYAGMDAPFVALNTAFLGDGFFVYLPRGTVLGEPLHLVYVAQTQGEPSVNHPRTLVVCEENSQALIVQSYLASSDRATFTNAVTEIVLGPRAQVEHCKVQRESQRAYHFEALQILQNRGSRFAAQAITLGGGMARNEINAVLNGEGCECTLNGLYVANDNQHIENRTSIDHAMPRCASHEVYKGILNGKARGVFNGKILVRQDAQKTDAKQTNRTLLLSDEATINSKPQLEIFADDVKCTHGATVGQLAAEAIFYLRSRGIGLDQARAVLTYAFADDILQHIKVAALRRDLESHFLAAQHLPADLREEEGAI